MKGTRADRIAKVIVILLIAGLLIFEMLNLLHVLELPITFGWMGLIITVLMFIVGIEILNHYLSNIFRFSLSSRVMLIILIAFYLDALGDIYNFYTRWEWFDQFMHFLSGVLIAGTVAVLTQKAILTKKIQIGGFLRAFFSVACSVAIGVIYEIEEYLEDAWTGSHRLGDGFDTANDLLMATLGGMLAVFLVYMFIQKIDLWIESRES